MRNSSRESLALRKLWLTSEPGQCNTDRISLAQTASDARRVTERKRWRETEREKDETNERKGRKMRTKESAGTKRN